MHYAPDLLDYYEELGDKKPTVILADPEFTRRALSESSPSALVRAVASEIAPENINSTIENLSKFERARVLMILGEKEKASELFQEILAKSQDKITKGKTFANLAHMKIGTMDFDEFEGPKALYKAATKEGYLAAYAQWAFALELIGRKDDAIYVAKAGLARGDEYSAVSLIRLMPEDNEEPDTRGFWELCKASLRAAWEEQAPTQTELNRREFAKIGSIVENRGIDIKRTFREYYAGLRSKDGKNTLSRVTKFLRHEEEGYCGVTIEL